MNLYSNLQSLIYETKDGELKLSDGNIEFSREDLEFIGFNNRHNYSPDSLVTSISLFTKDGEFFDNIPVKLKLSDEVPWLAFVKDYTLYITLPREDFEFFDPDMDIIREILAPFRLTAHYQNVIQAEFKGAIIEYLKGKKDIIERSLDVINSFADIIFKDRDENSLKLFKKHILIAMRICISSIILNQPPKRNLPKK